MLLDTILHHSDLPLTSHQINTIRIHCTQFIKESKGVPLLRELPRHVGYFSKIKVRHKRGSGISELFNKAFNSRLDKLYERAIFAVGSSIIPQEINNLYYVFPVNGYKYLYHKNNYGNAEQRIKELVEKIMPLFSQPESAEEIVTDLLKYSYVNTNLYEGITDGCEIIVYDIPCYYVVSKNIDYENIIKYCNQ